MLLPDGTVELSVFTAKCGHKWIGSQQGSYQCPVCGLWEGDHHLTGWEDLPVQVNDWGNAWEQLVKLGKEAWAKEEAEAEARANVQRS
jgi:hypothetical protein